MSALLNLLLSLFTLLAPLQIKVTPHFGISPQDVRIEIITPRSDLNLYTCVRWDSEEGEAGSSCWEMLGAQEPITKQFWIKSLPAGEYEIEVILQQRLEKQFNARERVEILSNR